MNNNMNTGRAPLVAVDPGYLLVISYLSFVIFLVLQSWCQPVGAATEAGLDLDAIHGGQLLMATAEPGHFQQAPLLSMAVEIDISGIVARTTMTQRFTNTTGGWAEAVYVFPLPDDSAVDHLDMQIGSRRIIGQIQEKKQAKKTYDQAKMAGKKATLLSQRRPNIFTTAVANIAPNETLIITLKYQQIVKRLNTHYSLRFPMVVGPRYHPGTCSVSGPTTSSHARKDARQNGEHRVTALTSPGRSGQYTENRDVNPISLHINLAPGMELGRVASLYHGITTSQQDDNSVDIVFSGEVKADRDFVLEWEPKETQAPVVSVFSEQKDNSSYLLLMVMPPASPDKTPLPRETVFILDTSGSMGGASIRQAKDALQLAVARMRPEDRFNIIAFSSNANSLFSSSRPGDSTSLQQAKRFIARLDAQGGTEMRPALELALDGRNSHERIRQIVFLTDGCVDNEKELFALIKSKLGDSRLFTVGIGSAPNSYFMTRAASMGRGSYTFIGKPEEVQDKMTNLFQMLEQPAITNLAVNSSATLTTLPDPVPDLYQGEPLLVMIKSEQKMTSLDLSGTLADRTRWQHNIPLADFKTRPGIATLWARKKVRQLQDSLAAGADLGVVQKQVTTLALTHHLVSPYTSLVAVEEQVSKPQNQPLQHHTQPLNLPAGWQYDTVFAGNAATATPSAMLILAGFLLVITAAAGSVLTRRQG